MATQKTRKDYENEVRSWGFSHVFTWTDGSYVRPPSSSISRLATSQIQGTVGESLSRQLANIQTPDNRNAHYSPHTHAGLTTHLILKGQLTITYPKDENPTKETFGVGDRVDVDAGRVHEVWTGKEGCTYVIGE